MSLVPHRFVRVEFRIANMYFLGFLKVRHQQQEIFEIDELPRTLETRKMKMMPFLQLITSHLDNIKKLDIDYNASLVLSSVNIRNCVQPFLLPIHCFDS